MKVIGSAIRIPLSNQKRRRRRKGERKKLVGEVHRFRFWQSPRKLAPSFAYLLAIKKGEGEGKEKERKKERRKEGRRKEEGKKEIK